MHEALWLRQIRHHPFSGLKSRNCPIWIHRSSVPPGPLPHLPKSYIMLMTNNGATGATVHMTLTTLEKSLSHLPTKFVNQKHFYKYKSAVWTKELQSAMSERVYEVVLIVHYIYIFIKIYKEYISLNDECDKLFSKEVSDLFFFFFFLCLFFFFFIRALPRGPHVLPSNRFSGYSIKCTPASVCLSVYLSRSSDKAGYTANISCGRVGRGGNACFHTFWLVFMDQRTDRPTDRPTDGRTDGRTKPLIELRVRN